MVLSASSVRAANLAEPSIEESGGQFGKFLLGALQVLLLSPAHLALVFPEKGSALWSYKLISSSPLTLASEASLPLWADVRRKESVAHGGT